MQRNLFFGRWQVSTTAMRHFRSHANALAQSGVWVNCFTNVHRICAHFNGQRDLSNHVACMGAHHTAAQDLAVAVGFGAVVKQQFGHAFVAAVGNGADRGGSDQEWAEGY